MRWLGVWILVYFTLTVNSLAQNETKMKLNEIARQEQISEAKRLVRKIFPIKGSLDTASYTSMEFDGLKRDYLFQVPDGPGPFPVVILLHGGTQTAEKVWIQTSLPVLAIKNKFILVAPDGIDSQWNDGREQTLSGKRSTADDVGFLRALIAKVVAENNGIAGHVYITGASNGGEMTYRMLCEASEMFAAAAPFIATLPVALSQSCKPAKPVKMLLTFGTDDPLMNYQGGTKTRKGRETVTMLSAEDTVKFWANVNGCGSTRTDFQMPDLDPKDGTTIRRTIYAPCTSGQTVGSIVIKGGGHAWPNSPRMTRFVERMVGKSSYDIDAGQEIVKFFANKSQ
jgi:polyhydroxybutyrate depolymerase